MDTDNDVMLIVTITMTRSGAVGHTVQQRDEKIIGNGTIVLGMLEIAKTQIQDNIKKARDV